MKRFTIALLGLAMMLLTSATAFAYVDVVLPPGTYNVTYISFDYTYGGSPAEDEFQIKGIWGGQGRWTMDVNFDEGGAPLVIDTDYGPYIVPGEAGLYSGSHHYDFMLNSYTGLWTLAIDNSLKDFYATAATNATQPDGFEVTVGGVVANKYYSDESVTSFENAIALGWATLDGDHLDGNASRGVGGVDDFKLRFYLETGDSYDNITSSNVPEPATIIVWSLLGLTAAGLGLWRRMRAA